MMQSHMIEATVDPVLEEVARRVERRALWRRRREEWGTRIVVGILLVASATVAALAMFGAAILIRWTVP